MPSDVLYLVPNLEKGLQLSDVDPLVRRKELIYIGNFRKKNNSEDIRFDVDETTLQHWHNTFIAMSANGIEVPVPEEHTTDLTKRRGTLIKTEIALNKRGLRALYGHIKFKDIESLKLAETTNASIFVPPELTDGKDNTYHHPITQVALTDYPVIPGLEKFQSIAASLVLSENSNMSLRAIAKSLGIKDDVEDKELETAIGKAIAELKKQIKASDPPEVTPTGAGAGAGAGAGNLPANPPVVSLSMVNLLKDNRRMKLMDLQNKGKIVPAVREEFEKEYCSDTALKLSLSLSANDTDPFEKMLSIIANNEAVMSFAEKTRGQSIALSNPIDAKENPLIAVAERLAKEAKETVGA